jgi:hypothetical protein
VPGLRGLLNWTCGRVCHEQERVLVPFSDNLLCGAAVGSGFSFPLSACVCLLVWFPCFDLELSRVTHQIPLKPARL